MKMLNTMKLALVLALLMLSLGQTLSNPLPVANQRELSPQGCRKNQSSKRCVRSVAREISRESIRLHGLLKANLSGEAKSEGPESYKNRAIGQISRIEHLLHFVEKRLG